MNSCCAILRAAARDDCDAHWRFVCFHDLAHKRPSDVKVCAIISKRLSANFLNKELWGSSNLRTKTRQRWINIHQPSDSHRLTGGRCSWSNTVVVNVFKSRHDGRFLRTHTWMWKSEDITSSSHLYPAALSRPRSPQSPLPPGPTPPGPRSTCCCRMMEEEEVHSPDWAATIDPGRI